MARRARQAAGRDRDASTCRRLAAHRRVEVDEALSRRRSLRRGSRRADEVAAVDRARPVGGDGRRGGRDAARAGGIRAPSASRELAGECLDALPVDVRPRTSSTPAALWRRRRRRRRNARHASSSARCARSRASRTTPACRSPIAGRGSIARRCCAISCRIRRHPGFHEHCVERIFVDVAARCAPRGAHGLRALHAPRRHRHQSVSHRCRAAARERAHGAPVIVARRASSSRASGRMDALSIDSPPCRTLTLALSKGRIFDETLPLLAAAGIVPAEDPETSRKLDHRAPTEPGVSLVIVRAVRRADLRAVRRRRRRRRRQGRAARARRRGSLPAARPRASAAAGWWSRRARGFDWSGTVQRGARIRVATKYVQDRARALRGQGHARRPDQALRLDGARAARAASPTRSSTSCRTGNTLKANDLVAVEDIMPISARLIVNPGGAQAEARRRAAAARRARRRAVAARRRSRVNARCRC